MIITVAGGKGGVGRTTVATGLALALMQSPDELGPEQKLVLVDCDVGEPTAALLVRPHIRERQDVDLLMPQVNEDACTLCGRCAEVCQYHAIAIVRERVLTFPALCRGCQSCLRQCPADAIGEAPHRLGVVETGRVGSMGFVGGTMNAAADVGDASWAVPIIRQAKHQALDRADGVAIVDAPSGVTPPAIEALRGSDVVVLVTEPTPFGLHTLHLILDVVQKGLQLPVGVVINRDGVGDDGVAEYCRVRNAPILLRIPWERRIATAYAAGQPLVTALPEYQSRFLALYRRIVEEWAP